MLNEASAAAFPRNILDALAQAGVDLVAAAGEAGLRPGALDTGLTEDEFSRFCHAAAKGVRDPAFGLHAGTRMRPERFGTLGLYCMAAPTLEAGLERAGRYRSLLWADDFDALRRDNGTLVVRRREAHPRPYERTRIDMQMAALVSFARLVTGMPIRPVRVTVSAPEPSCAAEYRRLFDCEVLFDQPVDSIEFRDVDMALPLISANAAFDHLVARALGRAPAFGAQPSPVARARSALMRMMHERSPSLAEVARELDMSTRTLQRRLGEEQRSFRELVDDVRRELAQCYLRSGTSTSAEVSYRLGFVESSSFTRAFKRWTGTTPNRFRKSAAAGREPA